MLLGNKVRVFFHEAINIFILNIRPVTLNVLKVRIIVVVFAVLLTYNCNLHSIKQTCQLLAGILDSWFDFSYVQLLRL
jgi:hypothetical protein